MISKLSLHKFWAKVNKDTESGCWEWTASTRNGYGVKTIKRKPSYSHRISWEIYNGPIPDGLWVLHKCDNRKCVNPDHLFLGTLKDNVDDAVRKGRHLTPGSKLNAGQRINITMLTKFLPVKTVARIYNINITTAYRIKNKYDRFVGGI